MVVSKLSLFSSSPLRRSLCIGIFFFIQIATKSFFPVVCIITLHSIAVIQLVSYWNLVVKFWTLKSISISINNLTWSRFRLSEKWRFSWTSMSLFTQSIIFISFHFSQVLQCSANIIRINIIRFISLLLHTSFIRQEISMKMSLERPS